MPGAHLYFMLASGSINPESSKKNASENVVYWSRLLQIIT